MIPFIRDPSNVFDTDELIFTHDKTLCMKGNATRHLLYDKIEKLMPNEDHRNRYNYDAFETNLENTLKDFEDGTDLFSDLLRSMPKRFGAFKAAVGDSTTF